ncbi:MAG: ABC transporter ATP-binding protein, partial [Micavibrio aeruginosavorus]
MHLYKFDVPATQGEPPRSFSAFLKYIWNKNPGVLTLCAALDIIHYIRYALSLLIMGKIIDALQSLNIVAGIPDNVAHLLVLLFSVLAVGELAHVWLTYIFVYWRPRLRSAIRADFLNYTMQHSHAYFQDHFAGSLARKISELSEGTIRLQDIQRNQLFFALITMITSTIIAASIHLIFAGFLLVFIISVALPIILRLKRIRSRSLKYANQRSHMTGIVVDTLTNMPSVKSFAANGYESDFISEQSAIEYTLAGKLMRNMSQIENLRRISLVFLGGGMMALACYAWAKGMITVGEVSTLSALGFSLAGATWMLGGGIVSIVDEVGNISDALRTITPQHHIQDNEEAADLKVINGLIEYRDVSFQYGTNSIFDRMNITIRPREKIALIGPSGAGKSTFVNLLLRFYDIESGTISIDGQDISNVTQNSLRENIAVIPQDTALFHRTLIENIRYGLRDATDEQVIEAAKRAHAHEFISALSNGYHTMVGERGIKLSGGQRQRIAIARAILKNAPILILDEATSALDSESELLIQSALDKLMKDKTVIAIAHRLSTIARMDRILVFDKGMI